MSATLRRSLELGTPDPTDPLGPLRVSRIDGVITADEAGRLARIEHTVVPYLPWLVVAIGIALILPAGTRFFGALTVALGGLFLLIDHSVRYPTDVRHCCSVNALPGFRPSPVSGLAVEVRGRLVDGGGRAMLRFGSHSVPLGGLRRRALDREHRDPEPGDPPADQVVVTGWYRTVPTPMLEVRQIRRADGSVLVVHRWRFGSVASVVVAAAGLALAAASVL